MDNPDNRNIGHKN